MKDNVVKRKGPCKLPGKEESLADRKTRHKLKMMTKDKFRDKFYMLEYSQATVYTPANLGKNHPDYGMSMKDHLIEKEQRITEKSS